MNNNSYADKLSQKPLNVKLPGVTTATALPYITSTLGSKIVLLANVDGKLSNLDSHARRNGAKWIIHTGSFGFFDASSVERLSLDFLCQKLKKLPSTGLTVRPEEMNEPSIRSFFTSNLSLLSELHEFISGARRLDVPTYVVYGCDEDVAVVDRFKRGLYQIPNLYLLDYETDFTIATDDDHTIRIFGLGGHLSFGELFSMGEGDDFAAGSGSTMWTTLIQMADFLRHAHRLEGHPEEMRIFVAVPPPVTDPLSALIAAAVKADIFITTSPEASFTSIYKDSIVHASDAQSKILLEPRAELNKKWQSIYFMFNGSFTDDLRDRIQYFFNCTNIIPVAFDDRVHISLGTEQPSVLMVDGREERITLTCVSHFPMKMKNPPKLINVPGSAAPGSAYKAANTTIVSTPTAAPSQPPPEPAISITTAAMIPSDVMTATPAAPIATEISAAAPVSPSRGPEDSPPADTHLDNYPMAERKKRITRQNMAPSTIPSSTTTPPSFNLSQKIIDIPEKMIFLSLPRFIGMKADELLQYCGLDLDKVEAISKRGIDVVAIMMKRVEDVGATIASLSEVSIKGFLLRPRPYMGSKASTRPPYEPRVEINKEEESRSEGSKKAGSRPTVSDATNAFLPIATTAVSAGMNSLSIAERAENELDSTVEEGAPSPNAPGPTALDATMATPPATSTQSWILSSTESARDPSVGLTSGRSAGHFDPRNNASYQKKSFTTKRGRSRGEFSPRQDSHGGLDRSIFLAHLPPNQTYGQIFNEIGFDYSKIEHCHFVNKECSVMVAKFGSPQEAIDFKERYSHSTLYGHPIKVEFPRGLQRGGPTLPFGSERKKNGSQGNLKINPIESANSKVEQTETPPAVAASVAPPDSTLPNLVVEDLNPPELTRVVE